MGMAVVNLSRVSVQDVPDCDVKTAPDPYVRVVVIDAGDGMRLDEADAPRARNAAKQNTYHPRWNEPMVVPLCDAAAAAKRQAEAEAARAAAASKALARQATAFLEIDDADEPVAVSEGAAPGDGPIVLELRLMDADPEEGIDGSGDDELGYVRLTLRHRIGNVTKRRLEGRDGSVIDCFVSFSYEVVLPPSAYEERENEKRQQRAARAIQQSWGGRSSDELRDLWRKARHIVDNVADHARLEQQSGVNNLGANILFRAVATKVDQPTLAAASAFEMKHTRFRMVANHRMHLVKQIPAFDG